MLNGNEIIMLVLGIGILFLIYVYRDKIRRVKSYKVLLGAFYLLIASWTFTLMEDLMFYRWMNLLEHACFAASSLMTLYWCYRVATTLKREASQFLSVQTR